jgi:hypothetical protein
LLSCSGSIFWSTLYTLSVFFYQVYYDLVSVARPAYLRVIGDVQWWWNNWKQGLFVRGRKRPSNADAS